MLCFRQVLTSSIGKKTLMAISGLGLGGFLLAHLAGNLTIFLGRQAFLNYAQHLHSLGPLLHLLEAGLLFFFLLHVLTAVLLYLENLNARPTRYAVGVQTDRSWPARLMPYSGLVIFLFLCLHLANFHFADARLVVADKVASVFSQPLYVLFYMLSMLALGFHICHGFWSMLQTLGLHHPRYTTLLERGPLTVGFLISLLFFLIPAAVLFAPCFLR